MPYVKTGPFTNNAPPAIGATFLNNAENGIIEAYDKANEALAAALASNPPAEVTPSYVFNVKNYGATGNGSADDSNSIKACIAAAIATKGSSATVGPTRAEVVFPPGVYKITQNDTLMLPTDGNGGQTGLTIRGYGKAVTELVFSPTTVSAVGGDPWVGNLFSSNKNWRSSVIKDMTITSTNDNACAFYFYQDGGGNNQNQGSLFQRIRFQGNWKRVFGFDGSATAQLNSEMTFEGLEFGTAAYGDAMFKVGGINGVTYPQQNQFLDYWFINTWCILNGGTFIDVSRGGSLHVINGSWSAQGAGAPAMTFIKLRANSNTTSATNFSFRNVRFEPKASTHTVLDDQVGHGNILFENCIDLSSIQNTASYDYALRKHTFQSPWGGKICQTNVSYKNCALAGYDSFTGQSGVGNRGWITYDNCYFYRGDNAEMALASQTQGAQAVVRWSGASPRYSFQNNWNVLNIQSAE